MDINNDIDMNSKAAKWDELSEYRREYAREYRKQYPERIQATRIRAARKLLEKNGYTVIKGEQL